MNRSIANWLATNPGGAVFATGLLGLLPFFGIGFFFFLPGAVPALLALARGPRQGAMVAAGASLLLALAIWFIGRSVPVGVIYALWVLGPPLALAWVLRRTGSLSLCLQLAALAGIGLLAVLHAALGDPTQFWSPVVRQLAQEMQRRGLSLDDVFLDTLARGLWGWVTVLTLLLGMCAVFLARWWQHLSAESGSFGTEFRQIRLGRALGIVAAAAIVGVVPDRSPVCGRPGTPAGFGFRAGRCGRGAPDPPRTRREHRVALGALPVIGVCIAVRAARARRRRIRGQLAAVRRPELNFSLRKQRWKSSCCRRSPTSATSATG